MGKANYCQAPGCWTIMGKGVVVPSDDYLVCLLARFSRWHCEDFAKDVQSIFEKSYQWAYPAIHSAYNGPKRCSCPRKSLRKVKLSARNTSSHTYFSHIRKGQVTTSNPPLTRCPSRGSSRLPARCGCYILHFFCPLSSKILLPINLSTHHCHSWTRAKVPWICVVSFPKVPPPPHTL